MRNFMVTSDNVTITDATSAEFNEFLQFSYLGTVKLSAAHEEKVLQLVEKYQVNIGSEVSSNLIEET